MWKLGGSMMALARRTRTWALRALACGTLLATAALGLPVQQAAAAPTDPAVPLPQLLSRLQDLYQKAEVATETYDQAKEQLTQHRSQAKLLSQQLADERIALADAKDRAAQLAQQQYKNGAVSPYANLLLSDTPQDLFNQSHFLRRAAGSQAELVAELKNGEVRISALSKESQHSLDSAQQLEQKQHQAKDEIEAQLANVEKIVAGLTGTQLSELQRLEQQGIEQAQRDFIDSKQLGASGRAPSTAGNHAIGYAYRQLGKPYVWGAEGPDSYDCSGLTSQAWASAGLAIPRTSEEQWKQLTHIPLNAMRPGDLVVYFAGATHVAIYIGDGLVIQAPRPGAVVKISPIAANPILGAVRPDPAEASLDGYQPLAAPSGATGATAPTPIG
jgi:cell wall-associated NlpC family hydrolase